MTLTEGKYILSRLPPMVLARPIICFFTFASLSLSTISPFFNLIELQLFDLFIINCLLGLVVDIVAAIVLLIVIIVMIDSVVVYKMYLLCHLLLMIYFTIILISGSAWVCVCACVAGCYYYYGCGQKNHS